MKFSLNLSFLITVGIIVSPFIFSCGKAKGWKKAEGMIWHTMYHVTYYGEESLKDSILPVLNEVGHSLSVFEKNSLVSQLNGSRGVKADRHLLKVYEASKKIQVESRGVFDPTVSPLIDAWGFGLGHVPSADTLAVDSILQFIGIEKTSLRGDSILKDDLRTRFNFSAIAKGYGCDALGEMFRRNGVENYMVEIGGEITLKGKSPSGNNWKIAVDAPIEGNFPGEETAMVIELTDCGVATSGNYRNYREVGGKKVAHTISPVTGRPVPGKILSATVIALDCMTADAVATACMASSEPEKVLSATACEGLLIYPDSVWMSEGFGRYISEEVSEPGRKDRN